MNIKQDEIELVKLILSHCTKPYDRIPTEKIDALDIHPKRIDYLLHKMSHFIEYGINVWYGWIDQSPQYIRDYYKRVHEVEL